MAYSQSVNLALGPAQTGLTLSAQLKDLSGNVGGAVATGFVEFGQGNYGWLYAGFPDLFRGWVVFSAGAVVKATAEINPSEAGTDPPGVTTLLGRIASALTSLPFTVDPSIPRSIMSEIVPEKSTMRFDGTLKDEAGVAIPAASLTTLTLTLYALDAAETIVNTINGTNILNADRGVIDASGNLTITFLPADMVILDATQAYERRVFLLQWTYGTKAGRHEVEFTVANLSKVS